MSITHDSIAPLYPAGRFERVESNIQTHLQDNTNSILSVDSPSTPDRDTVLRLYRNLLRESKCLDAALSTSNSPCGALELKQVVRSIQPNLPKDVETSLQVRSSNTLIWNGKPVSGQVYVAVRNIFRESVLNTSITSNETLELDWISRGVSALRLLKGARIVVETKLGSTTELERWRSLIQMYQQNNANIPIEMGAFVMSKNEVYGDSSMLVGSQLDSLADHVRCSLDDEFHWKKELSIEEEYVVIQKMNEILFNPHEQGGFEFRGTIGNHLPPDHSLIDQVLLERRGLPATIALIYIAVGQRLGIDIHPVALPSLVVVQPSRWSQPGCRHRFRGKYIDVTQKGKTVTRRWCEDYVKNNSSSIHDKKAFFKPVHPLSLHARILYNLVLGSAKRDDKDAMAWLEQLMTLMENVNDVRNMEPEQMA